MDDHPQTTLADVSRRRYPEIGDWEYEPVSSPSSHLRILCRRWLTVLALSFVDVYSADGTQLAQLGGEGLTAVPAVAVLHPNKDWIAGGTASGKLCLWM